MMSLEDSSDVMPCLFVLHHGLKKKQLFSNVLNGLKFRCSQLHCARKYPYYTLQLLWMFQLGLFILPLKHLVFNTL